jgi:hypothetical protein
MAAVHRPSAAQPRRQRPRQPARHRAPACPAADEAGIERDAYGSGVAIAAFEERLAACVEGARNRHADRHARQRAGSSPRHSTRGAWWCSRTAHQGDTGDTPRGSPA